MTSTAQALAVALNKALDLWVSLSGVSPNQKSFKLNMGGKLSDWEVVKYHEAIADALLLDDTNVSGYLMLDALSNYYFKERNFSVDELLSGDPAVSQYLELTKAFKAVIGAPELIQLGKDFAQRMVGAVTHYGANTPPVLEAIQHPHQLAFLRRDALRSIQKLRVDQFLVGAAEPTEVKPAYVEEVHRFWNINSLIAAACKQPSGVSLNLIVDPNEYHSYFAFAIRNGGNLFVLSDVPVNSHPLRRFMSRRPDREFSAREAQNHFPYDLLGVKYEHVGDDEYRMVIDRSDEKGIIPLQQEFDSLKPIKDLRANEVIWLVMMFDLILEKFWAKGYQSPALSYTGAMIHHENELIESAAKMNLPVAQYHGLNLPSLSTSDVQTGTAQDAAIGVSGGNANLWMEQRYGHLVPDETINLVATPEMHYYLEPATGHKNKHRHTNSDKSVALPGSVMRIRGDSDQQDYTGKTEGRYKLHSLDGSSFGTKEEINNDRIFLARHNYAKGIQKLADEEFYRRKKEIIAWWHNAVEANKERLIALCANESYWLDKKSQNDCVEFFGVGREQSYRLMHRDPVGESQWVLACESSTKITGGWNQSKGEYDCCLTGAKASYRALFTPQTVEALAFIAGCAVHELPDVLQHWSAHISSRGNHLINRIDPLSWVGVNPWSVLKFPVVVALSKRGLAKIEAGIAKAS